MIPLVSVHRRTLGILWYNVVLSEFEQRMRLLCSSIFSAGQAILMVARVLEAPNLLKATRYCQSQPECRVCRP